MSTKVIKTIKKYTDEEIDQMLEGYKRVKRDENLIRILKDLERKTWIRYYDTKFKAGGLILNVYPEDNTIMLRNGTFTWKIKLENIKRIWIKDIRIINKKKEKEEEEYCKKLLRQKYKIIKRE